MALPMGMSPGLDCIRRPLTRVAGPAQRSVRAHLSAMELVSTGSRQQGASMLSHFDQDFAQTRMILTRCVCRAHSVT